MERVNMLITGVLVLSLGAIACNAQVNSVPKKVEISFVETDQKPLLAERNIPVWQVDDDDGFPDSTGTIVIQNDTLQFNAPDSSALVLDLPNNYNSLFKQVNEGAELTRQREYIAAGGTLTFIVKDNAKPGTYNYAVLLLHPEYCTMVIGDSIPTLKIKEN